MKKYLTTVTKHIMEADKQKHQKLEAKFQTLFSHWLKKEWKTSAAFELKVVRSGRFRISQLKEHQIHALKVANENLLYWKLADVSYTALPFDCFTLFRTPAYVVVYFIESKTFYLVPIKNITSAMKKQTTFSEYEVCAMAAEAVKI